MAKKLNILHLTAFVVLVLTVTSWGMLVSGQPLECGVKYGPLAYDGISNRPVGVVNIYNSDRPDLFLYSSHFAKGLVLYKYITDQDGVPVFGEPVALSVPDIDGKTLSTGKIFQEPDGSIHGLWCDKNTIFHSEFDRKTLAFSSPKSAKINFLPRSPCALEVCGNPDGSYDVIIGLSDGLSNKAPAFDFDKKYLSYYRDPRYIMYDGAGVSRGQFPYVAMYCFSLDGLSTLSASNFRQISATQKEVRETYSTITKANLGVGHEKGLITGSSYGGLYYYKALSNYSDVDTKLNLVDEKFITIRHPAIWPSPIAYPDSQTGYSDLIAGAEGGTYFYKFTGRFSENGNPVFADPVSVLEKDSKLYGGTLVVPNVVDWDGDGNLDIVAGNSHGSILFFKNNGTSESPIFMPAQKLKAGGYIIHVQGGYSGSVQGPGEARWGYTCPTVYDWNQDGLPDILMSDATAKHTVYMNIGSKNDPVLDQGKPLYFDGLDYHGTWRCKPAIGKMGEKTAYITLDDQDQFHLYYQVDIYNISDGGKLKLTDGSFISANFLKAGGTGRLKFTLFDWDNDGNKDLIIGTPRHASVPNPDTGYPWNTRSKYKDEGSAVLFMKNAGTDDEPVFEFPQFFKFKGHPIFLGQHSCSPAVAPIGTSGKPGLIVGTEIGRFMYYSGDDLTTGH